MRARRNLEVARRGAVAVIVASLITAGCSTGDASPATEPDAVTAESASSSSDDGTEAGDSDETVVAPDPSASGDQTDPTDSTDSTDQAPGGESSASSQPPVDTDISPTTSEPDAICPLPTGFSDTGVTVSLERILDAGDVVSFGVPLPRGTGDITAVSVTSGGAEVESAVVYRLLDEYGPDGATIGVRSILVQLPSAVLEGDCGEVEVSWNGDGAGLSDGEPVAFSDVSAASDETVRIAERTIEERDGVAVLVETSVETRVLFPSREPAAMAQFPDGYLAATGIIGHQVATSQIGDDLAGVRFISEMATPFGLAAMYRTDDPVNPAAVIGPADDFEGWLYDRCATFLSFAAQTADPRFLRESYRTCAFYADSIELSGENRGISTIKPEPDAKYSHVRGLYAYYALTGDPAVLEAAEAIADMWLAHGFVVNYREGSIGDAEDLWTERLLGHSLEGLVYTHLLTGDTAHLDAATDLVATAHSHITGDAGTLAALNPDVPAFPPQSCLVHTARQGDEGEDEPWCSPWMSVLMVDPLLAYQDQTGDGRVDEIFIRLARFVRDVGSTYFLGEPIGDSFLEPTEAYDPEESVEGRRLLVPVYGGGVDVDGERVVYYEYDDWEHCMDVTGLTAAAIRALVRTGGFDANPVGPFASEGESFVALHHEFAFCTYAAILDDTRPGRAPGAFSSEELAEGLSDPATFIEENKIGWPIYNIGAARQLSWWFNTSLQQFALLADAGVPIPELHPGSIQPA